MRDVVQGLCAVTARVGIVFACEVPFPVSGRYHSAQLLQMFRSTSFTHDFHPHAEDIAMDPGAFLYDVLDGDSGAGDELAQLCDAAGPVAHRHFELHQALLCSQPALQTPAQDSRVYVTS